VGKCKKEKSFQRAKKLKAISAANAGCTERRPRIPNTPKGGKNGRKKVAADPGGSRIVRYKEGQKLPMYLKRKREEPCVVSVIEMNTVNFDLLSQHTKKVVTW